MIRPVRLTAGKKPGKDKLVIYLSPVPLALDPLTIPEGNSWLTLTGEARKEIGILKEKLQTIAKDKTFNRATVLLPRRTRRQPGDYGDGNPPDICPERESLKTKKAPYPGL